MQLYGQKYPPLIDVGQIDEIPVALFCGNRDNLSTLKDTNWLKDKIKSLVYYKEFRASHLSFQLGKDMRYFQDVLKLLAAHT